MELFATRAMTRFACIGSACEDNCCHWGIAVDRAHYDTLKERMSSPEERTELIRTIRINKPDTQAQDYAMMVLDDHGFCTMLDEGGLCKIQGRYGEEYLSNACAQYPRIVGRLGKRFELQGLISCPEVARGSLLTDDGLEFTTAARASFARNLINREIDPTDEDNYRRAFYPVRGMMMSLLRVEQFPVASRLFFIAFFADKTRAFMKPKAVDFDSKMMLGIMNAMREMAALQQLHDQFDRIELNASFAMSVVRELLMMPTEKIAAPLRDVIAEVLPRFAAAGTPVENDDTDALAESFETLRPPLSARVAKRIDQLVGRFALHYVQREWYVSSPSLMQYVMGLLSRVALIRFLLLGHPLITTRGADEDDETITMLDALMVKIVYSLSRTLDHDEPLAVSFIAELEEQGMTKIEHAVCLCKI